MSLSKKGVALFDKRDSAPTRAFSRIKCAKTHSGPTSTVGSAEASSAGPRPAQSIFRDVHAAVKNGLNTIRGLRAANSARLFCMERWRKSWEVYRKNCRGRRHTRVPPYGEVHRRWRPLDFGRTESSAPTGCCYTKCVRQGPGAALRRSVPPVEAAGFRADRVVRPYGILVYKGYWYTKCVGQAWVPCRWGGGTHGCRPTEKCTAGGGRRISGGQSRPPLQRFSALRPVGAGDSAGPCLLRLPAPVRNAHPICRAGSGCPAAGASGTPPPTECAAGSADMRADRVARPCGWTGGAGDGK